MDIRHIAKLANLVIEPVDEIKLQGQFEDTLKTVEKINELNTSKMPPTSQVTGLTNVMRQDSIDPSRILTLKQALSGAKKVYNGYFVVPAVFDVN